MDKISLSIPCLILSSETGISGETEKHVLTPFGYLDILLTGSTGQDEEAAPYEIRVEGDIDSWMIDESMPAEFKAVLRRFVVEVAQLCTQSFRPGSGKNDFQLCGERQDIKITLKEGFFATTLP